MSNDSSISAVVYKSLEFLGYPRHRVGNDGSIWMFLKGSRTVKRGWKVVKPRLIGKKVKIRYLKLRLNGSAYKSVHRIVLLAFVGPCPVGYQSRHLNGVNTDNRLCNLSWGTAKENGNDKVVHGTSPKGVRNGRAKLREEEVCLIRILHRNGMSQRDIAKRFTISNQCVSCIVLKKTWRHV